MNYLKIAIKNIKKHRTQSLLNMLISIAVILSANLYIQNLYNVQEQLEKLPENMPVYGYITNVSGSQRAGLEIEERMVEQLQEMNLIKDVKCTSQLAAGEGVIEPEQWRQLTLSVVAANNITSVTETEVTDAGNYNEILKSDRKVCIVNQNTTKEKGWKTGEEIFISLYYYKLNNLGAMRAYPLQICKFKVESTIGDIAVDADRTQPDIILPMEAVKKIFREEGAPYAYDSVSFYARKPLELNEFKADAKQLGIQSVSPQSTSLSVKGTAMYLKDENFIALANQLKEQFQILKVFIPVLLIMLVLLEIVIAYLFVQRRKSELVIQRMLGLSKREVRKLFLWEQTITILAAGGLCFLVFMIVRYGAREVLVIILSVALSAAFGSYISLTRGAEKWLLKME